MALAGAFCYPGMAFTIECVRFGQGNGNFLAGLQWVTIEIRNLSGKMVIFLLEKMRLPLKRGIQVRKW